MGPSYGMIRDQSGQMQQNQTGPFPQINYYQPPNCQNNWGGTKVGPEAGIQNIQPQPQIPGYGFLPLNILDQVRNNCPSTSTPIFILPNGVTSNNSMPLHMQAQATPCVAPIPTCIPYTIPMPIFQPFGEIS